MYFRELVVIACALCCALGAPQLPLAKPAAPALRAQPEWFQQPQYLAPQAYTGQHYLGSSAYLQPQAYAHPQYLQGPAALPYASPSLKHAPLNYRTSPVAATRSAAILRQAQDVSFDGSYNYNFDSEDGISVQASGALRPLGQDEPGQAASGSFSYTSPEGVPITTTWYADETGFHAEGAHLPKGPEGSVRLQ